VSEGAERGATVALDGMGGLRRTHACGQVSSAHVGSEVVVAGWVHRRRDHGGVCFVDLRDREGVVQVVFKPEVAAEAHRRSESLRSEFVALVRGVVERRTPETVNPKLPTGEIEITARELRVLNAATPPPFAIEEDSGAEEMVRLRHRIHDLRRPPLQRALRVRHALYQSVRRTLAEHGFLEIETPILAKATPEGARDFLVPARLQPGSFYALPQSPQIMKQLLMISGFDRYFQIARCFRDEDLRADRQLEFTQIDLEMSFVGVEDVLAVLEAITVNAWRDAAGTELPTPFPRLSYAEAMARYGDADAFLLALRQANPIGVRSVVPAAMPRQANCYYSSSDAAFMDRYQALAEYEKVKTGEVPLEGGWRVYSSGAGIALRLIYECLLGIRRRKSVLVLDPVIPKALDGLRAEVELAGKHVSVVYRTEKLGYGPTAITLNGAPLPFEREVNTYRTGGAAVSLAAVSERLTDAANTLQIQLR